MIVLVQFNHVEENRLLSTILELCINFALIAARVIVLVGHQLNVQLIIVKVLHCPTHGLSADHATLVDAHGHIAPDELVCAD